MPWTYKQTGSSTIQRTNIYKIKKKKMGYLKHIIRNNVEDIAANL